MTGMTGGAEGDPEHWFVPVAEHLGKAYLRYSFTMGTTQEIDFLVGALDLRPGMRVLDVGCGPGRHAHELARRGVAVHGVDISQRFIDIARDAAPPLATFERLDARALDADREFDAVICLCQGAFGLMTANGDDALVLAAMARALQPGGVLALSAFNAYFAVKYHDAAEFDAAHRCQPRAHRRQERGGGVHRGRPVDGLLHAARAAPAVRSERPRCRAHLERRAGQVLGRGGHHGVARVPGRRPTTQVTNPQRADSIATRLVRRGRSHSPIGTLKANFPLSDTSTPSSTAFGTFDEEGNYTPRQVISDDLGMSFADAIAGTLVEVEDGQLVHGTVVKIDRDEVLLDIGYKSEGVIPARELSIRNDVNPNDIVKLGEKVEALVLQKEDKEGRLLLSKKRAQYERAWGNIEKLKEADGMVEGLVIEVVKGGLIVDIGLRGFLPASLVELRRVRDLQPYVGKMVQAKIIELDKNRNNVVLSRRAYLEETQKEARDEFLTNLKPGEIREGVVSSVVSFGAFVDLGGMDGLIHVSELSWKHVDHPGAVVAVGDPVTVQVLDVDFDRERISLSLKATQQDPWQIFANSHEVGQLVYGRITKLVPFGAFAQVGEGIEGLVHISEMSAHHVDAPEQVVTPGEELWVKIIDLDLARRRISLSIKQAAEGGELAEEYRQHFEMDEHGNWAVGADDVEREAAWAEYYQENPDEAPADPDAAPAAEAAGQASMLSRPSKRLLLRATSPPRKKPTPTPDRSESHDVQPQRTLTGRCGSAFRAGQLMRTMPIRTAVRTACVRSVASSFS